MLYQLFHKRQLRAAGDHLKRLARSCQRNAVRRLSGVDDVLQRGQEGIDRVARRKGQDARSDRHHPFPASGDGKGCPPQRRRTVDVLHVGDAARHAADDHVDSA